MRNGMFIEGKKNLFHLNVWEITKISHPLLYYYDWSLHINTFLCRYSEFYAFHKDLVKKDDHKIVSKFDFPPKKTVGNKAEKIVEDRRKRLQIYLRNVVNLMVHTNPSLAARPDKEHVLDIFPFFAESFSKAARNKTRGNPVTNQRPSIFNRRGRTASTTEPLAL